MIIMAFFIRGIQLTLDHKHSDIQYDGSALDATTKLGQETLEERILMGV